ncbi:MAG: glutathione S-transferase [Phenylobacterium zucineum]|nr:MAG: glutathione S-transferase [Phenylobacterium zucineum]
MSLPTSLMLMGAPGSPYTRKMLAVLRYRHIPYRLLLSNSPQLTTLPQAKVPLLPTFYLPGPDGEIAAVTDSTPLIRRFEAAFTGRSVIPANPVLAFLNDLIEDYADEWLTKAMFHYRWHYADDISKGAKILPCWRGFSVPDEVLAERGKFISERQIGRLRYVGSNPTTAQVIEASYVRFLGAMEDHLRLHPYLLGTRPSAADFAIYGQLSQLAEFDPTPMALTLKIAPRVTAWVGMLEDQSGIDPDDNGWFDPEDPPPTLSAILIEIGRVYPPVMLANAQAVLNKSVEVVAEVEGRPWRQQPFPYQAKCLGWLRESHSRLSGPDRDKADAVLSGTGCEVMFQ